MPRLEWDGMYSDYIFSLSKNELVCYETDYERIHEEFGGWCKPSRTGLSGSGWLPDSVMAQLVICESYRVDCMTPRPTLLKRPQILVPHEGHKGWGSEPFVLWEPCSHPGGNFRFYCAGCFFASMREGKWLGTEEINLPDYYYIYKDDDGNLQVASIDYTCLGIEKCPHAKFSRYSHPGRFVAAWLLDWAGDHFLNCKKNEVAGKLNGSYYKIVDGELYLQSDRPLFLEPTDGAFYLDYPYYEEVGFKHPCHIPFWDKKKGHWLFTKEINFFEVVLVVVSKEGKVKISRVKKRKLLQNLETVISPPPPPVWGEIEVVDPFLSRFVQYLNRDRYCKEGLAHVINVLDEETLGSVAKAVDDDEDQLASRLGGRDYLKRVKESLLNIEEAFKYPLGLAEFLKKLEEDGVLNPDNSPLIELIKKTVEKAKEI